VSIIEPVPDSTKLRVNDAGVRLLRSMAGHLAPVVVIGPYRSGKSFLINQMLGTGCGVLPTLLGK
jgi:Guanylate-binding protein, N-terminal domain